MVENWLRLTSNEFAEQQQTVGNCVVRSHDVGLWIRLNGLDLNLLNNPLQEAYYWIKLQELRTAATPHLDIGVIV